MRSFKGGVHPPYEKITSEKKIEELPPPEFVVIFLSQHTGAPCQPLVKKGDQVKKGQKIGDIDKPVTAPVHSPVSGKVKEIGMWDHPVFLKPMPAIIIENDGKDEEIEYKEDKNWLDIPAEEIRKRVREAGIVGLGGAAFPTHIKLNPPKPVDTVIINGAECEPYLTADDRLMREYPEDILNGAYLVKKTVGANKVFIGIEDNKPKAFEEIKKNISNSPFKDGEIEVVKLHTKYPQGSEKHLIKAILNREVPSGGLPFDVGVVVQNVGTCKAIYEAVRYGKPLIERVLTLSGNIVKNPGNYKVRIGTTAKYIIEKTGGFMDNKEPQKVIFGGPMMGIAQYTLNAPVVKGTSGIIVLEEAPFYRTLPCIQCGRCVDVCPMGLSPTLIARNVKLKKIELAVELGLFDCIECGSCSYICPSRRPLVEMIKYGKQEAKKK